MDRKWLFVLPNLFTISSIVCGIYAIVLATGAAGAADTDAFYRAAIAILFGAFFDGCDGRVARLTRTESEFGVQLDSLADVVTFGVAPAILMYKWALEPLGFAGVLISAAFVVAGALRLARFNVMANREMGPDKFFVGLPIPAAAGMVLALVIAATRAEEPQVVGPLPAAILTLVLSYLMVSRIRYHSFKSLRLQPRDLLVVAAIIAFGLVVAIRVRPSFVLVSYGSAYVLFGLVEEIVFRHRRDAEVELAGQASTSAVAVDEDTLDT